MSKTEKRISFLKKINKNFLSIAGLLMVAIILAQFGVLAALGSRGAEITSLRSKKALLREEIDSLKAQIDDSRTLSHIEDGLYEVYDLHSVDVITLTPPADDVTGSNF